MLKVIKVLESVEKKNISIKKAKPADSPRDQWGRVYSFLFLRGVLPFN